MKKFTVTFLFVILLNVCFASAQTVRVHKTSYNFDSATGRPTAPVAVPANVWTDVYALGLLPSELGGQWDLDAKIQIESGAVNVLQFCTFQLVIRNPQGVLVETIDEAQISKDAILTLKTYTPVYLGGRFVHSANGGLSAVSRINCTTAQTVTIAGTWTRGEYKK